MASCLRSVAKGSGLKTVVAFEGKTVQAARVGVRLGQSQCSVIKEEQDNSERACRTQRQNQGPRQAET